MTWFKQPSFQVSNDNGKTWTETGQVCGPGMLARVLHPDGTVLWQGRGIEVEKTCGGCDGRGKRTEYEFAEIK